MHEKWIRKKGELRLSQTNKQMCVLMLTLLCVSLYTRKHLIVVALTKYANVYVCSRIALHLPSLWLSLILSQSVRYSDILNCKIQIG